MKYKRYYSSGEIRITMSYVSFKVGTGLSLFSVLFSSCEEAPLTGTSATEDILPILDPVGLIRSDTLFLLPLRPVCEFDCFHSKLEIMEDSKSYLYTEPIRLEMEASD